MSVGLTHIFFLVVYLTFISFPYYSSLVLSLQHLIGHLQQNNNDKSL